MGEYDCIFQYIVKEPRRRWRYKENWRFV